MSHTGTLSAESPTPSQPPADLQKSKSMGKGSAFWLAFLAIIFTTFLSALDLTAVSTILPTVTADLHGGDKFTWVGSAYALASTAILPLSGALADIFGRKPIVQAAIVLFSLGSALAGSAQNMNWLIAARTVQGIGGGAINFLALALTADLVPFNERGLYQGLLSLTWALASAIGPPIGGVLAEKSTWRWLFYLNLPVEGVAFVLVWLFLRVRTPEGSVLSKLKRVDWLGNFIIISATTLAITGLTFAGTRFPWGSAAVIAPQLIGGFLTIVFAVYEKYVASEPAIPWEVMSNRTSIAGYLTTMAHGIIMISTLYYFPVYSQAALGAGPLRSAVMGLPTMLVTAPFALVGGVSVHILQKYRPTLLLGWIFCIPGMIVLSLLRAGDGPAKWAGYQIIGAIGSGLLFGSSIFPILADLPVERTASATATFLFCRSSAQTWGITIASTVLQNALKKRLPKAFVTQFPAGVEIAYAAIPRIGSLEEPLRSEVRKAFAASLAMVWVVTACLGGIGLLSVLFLMKEVPMRPVIDKKYGLEVNGGEAEDVEKASADTKEMSETGSEKVSSGMLEKETEVSVTCEPRLVN